MKSTFAVLLLCVSALCQTAAAPTFKAALNPGKGAIIEIGPNVTKFRYHIVSGYPVHVFFAAKAEVGKHSPAEIKSFTTCAWHLVLDTVIACKDEDHIYDSVVIVDDRTPQRQAADTAMSIFTRSKAGERAYDYNVISLTRVP